MSMTNSCTFAVYSLSGCPGAGDFTIHFDLLDILKTRVINLRMACMGKCTVIALTPLL